MIWEFLSIVLLYAAGYFIGYQAGRRRAYNQIPGPDKLYTWFQEEQRRGR
jgi:hypothetical protein